MSVIYGPLDTTYSDGHCTRPITVYSGPIASGTVIVVSWSGITPDSGTAAAGGFYLYGAPYIYGDPYVWSPINPFATPGAQTFTFTTTTSYDNAFLVVAGGGGAFCSGCGCHHGTVNGLTVDMAPPPAFQYCQYGTMANPDATIYQAVTDGLIDLVVGAALAGTAQAYLIPYVETALAAVEGSIWLGVNCATLPGEGRTLDFPNLQNLSPQTLMAWFQNAAWRFFCQCVPAPIGSPAPVLPPAPPIIPPTTTFPTQPGFVCENTDLCSYLSGIKAEIQQLLAQVSYLRTDVQLIQRQKVPFAYVPGTLHSGLTGAGQFAVQGILGLAVQVTTVPGASGEEAGDPIARFGLGWVTTGTADGWRKSVPIRANPQWVDVEPDDTLCGYSLEPLVVANIEEFAREP